VPNRWTVQASLGHEGQRPLARAQQAPHDRNHDGTALRAVFATELVTGELTSAKMIELWQRWVTGKATDTALNTLAQVRTFLAWLRNKEWLTGKDVVGGVEVLGKRRKGKPKLTYDEAKKLVAWCLDRPTDPGVVATLAAYWLGVRAKGISTQGRRCSTSPMPRRKRAAAGQAPAAGECPGRWKATRRFPIRRRRPPWLFRQVRRCCEGAGRACRVAARAAWQPRQARARGGS
jgi:hypothetical protein